MGWKAVKPRHEQQIVPHLEEYILPPEDIDDDTEPRFRDFTYGPIWLKTCSYMLGPKNSLPSWSTMELWISRISDLDIGMLAIKGEEIYFTLEPEKGCTYDEASEVAARGVWHYLRGYCQEESDAIGDMVALANSHEQRTLEDIAELRAEAERLQEESA